MTGQARGRLVAVGDVVPRHPITVGDGWAPFEGADVVVGDLEVPFTVRGLRWDKPVVYHAAPEHADEVRRMGFDLVSLANNQTMNHGRDGLLDTLDALDAAGVAYVGAGRDETGATAPWATTVGDTRVAFVGVTCVAPRDWDAGPQRPGLTVLRVQQALQFDPAWAAEEPGVAPAVRTWLEDDEYRRVDAVIARARQEADLVVALVHWGVGAGPALTDYQPALGRRLVEAGAGLVLGSHPPPLQGFDIHDGVLISYSLGTFVRQQPSQGVGPLLERAYARMPRETALLEVTIEAGRAVQARLHPAVLDADDVARPVAGEEARRIVRTVAERSTGLDPLPDPCPERLVVPLGPSRKR